MALTGKQFLITEWSWVILTLGLILTRFRIRYQRRKGLNVCDTFVALGWVFFLAQACMDIVLLQKGWFKNKVDPEATEFGSEHGLATRRDTIIALKVIYVETSMYYLTMYMVKYAMIFIYYEIIPPHLRALRMATHITLILTFVGGTSTFFMKLFWCNPISSNWAVAPAGRYCENLNSVVNTAYEWAFHMFTDLCIYIIPVFIVRNLQLPLSQKIGVALTFSSGFICIFFANLVQFAYIVDPAPYPLSWIYSAAEMTWALIVVCLPAFKIFLTKELWLGWRRARKRIGSIANTRKSGGSKGSSKGMSKLGSEVRVDEVELKGSANKNGNETVRSAGKGRNIMGSMDISVEDVTECHSPV